MPGIKNKQHYVFQAYLRHWKNENGRICVIKKTGKKLFATSSNNIMHQHQMYKIQELNDDEKEFFEFFMTLMNLSDADKSEMRGHINVYLTPFRNQKILDVLKTINPVPESHLLHDEIKKNIENLDRLICEQKTNSEEDFYGEYEADGIKWIDKLIAGDTSFYYINSSECTGSGTELPIHDERIEFLNFLCIQYFRTAGMRKSLFDTIAHMLETLADYQGRDEKDGSMEIKFRPENVNPEHILPHVIWVIQTRCSAALAKADLKIVKNKTSLPFITSDQPIINMKAEAGEEAPKELALYYPLSPRVAVIINEGKGEKELDKKLEVDRFNRMIWEHSFEFIISNNEDVLKGMLEMDW